ncbi:g8800 [Coccomyxa viridis]|uniref:G8800 protein n=1 Tax=Coccomyxa viridis TaxID=1274662 RepID=A0ABP1G2D8_9CHLO
MKTLIWLITSLVLYVVSFTISLAYVILQMIFGLMTSDDIEALNELLEEMSRSPSAQKERSEQETPEKGTTSQRVLFPHKTLEDIEENSLLDDSTPQSKQDPPAHLNTQETPDPKTPEIAEEQPISRRLSYSPESPDDASPLEQRDIEELHMPVPDGSALDAQALKQQELLANLDELLTPVELRDIEELLMPEIDEATPEGRLERAREIAGDGLLSEAAEKHPEAAFMVWMDNVRKSHTYRSQVYKDKLRLFDKNARYARMANARYNADRSVGEDLCRFNNCDLADEIDLYEWSPGAMMDWDGTEDDDVPLYSGPLHPDAPVPTR